ncbi:F-box/LRR-repeat protein [Trifolium pratense]|uniref:F-box/LRR-repeat protein n=1 Tax=Trifolium pratense TaxID=57577 RepID=A0A2K3N9M9_TRIPR|nr:F-box protein At5g03100-like [Trifolium pratense]PNX99738.1 F-box/LRR-repeat protein [Trifolium pratense]
MEDRISELPDEILSHILTMLSMKDVLKTSILSRRWCNVWSLRRDLCFDFLNVFGIENELNLDMSRHEFAKRVDQFVKKFKGIDIDSFLVNFKLDCEQSSTVNQWIRFAVARRVGKIDLLFLGSPCTHRTTERDYFKLDFALFLETDVSALNHLRLENCLVRNPINCDFTPFKNLRYLSLEDSKLDETFVESLLSNCPRLEELCLFFCEFKSSMPKIVSSSLRHLKVPGCYYEYNNLYGVDVNLILLDCLKLVSLELDFVELASLEEGLDTLNFNTPMLKSIEFSVSSKMELNTFVPLCATFFPELEIMHVTAFAMDTSSLKLTQPLKHLKELNLIIYIDAEVEYDLLWILNILQVCPLLQKLSIMFRHPNLSKKQKDIRDVEVFFHGEVKVIELRGCVGNWYETEFVMNVLKYAHKLEQIVVSPYWKGVDSLDWESNPEWFESGRERMIEKLRCEEVEKEKLVFL